MTSVTVTGALTRAQLLQIRDQCQHNINRTARKALFKNNIWCPNVKYWTVPEKSPYSKKNRFDNTKCGLLNPWSVNGKESIISELITDNDLDLLVLNETWWPADEIKSDVSRGLITPNSYSVLQTPRLGRGGGIAVIFRDNFIGKKANFKVFSSFEHQITTLKLPAETLIVTSVYFPHGYEPVIESELCELFDHLQSLNGKHLIVGDFNIHVNKNNDPNSTKFGQLVERYNLHQHVQFPTHRAGNTLDLVLTHSDIVVSDIKTDRSIPSDHFSILFKISTKSADLPKRTLSYRKWLDVDVKSFKSDIETAFKDYDPSSIEEAVSTFNTRLTDLADIHAPVKSCTVKPRPQSPWYTAELAKEKQRRRHLEQIFLKTKLVVDRERFNEQRNLYNSKLTSTKQSYYKAKIIEANNSKDRFNICNKLLNRSKKVVLPSHTCAKELADRFVNYFTDKISKIRADLEECSSDLTEANPDLSDFTGTPLSEFKAVSCDDVRKIISKSPSKSCVLDPTPTWLLKNCIDELAPALTTICNLSLSCAEFSDALKSAFVTPLIKKLTLDCEILKNYRPVSNLSFISKLIERIVSTQFIDHLKSNGLYEIYQSAYRQFHSTETALLRVQNDLLKSVDESGGAILVLLDLSAAFDTIDHDKLFKLLNTSFGIQGAALEWIKSYLSDRKQCVLIDGVTSDEFNLKWGVPQGSVLGPILFTIYTTPLASIIRKHGIEFYLYADDTQLYIAFKPSSDLSKSDGIKKLEGCIEDIRKWMTDNLLKLNDDKTELLVITSRDLSCDISLNVGGCDIFPGKEPPRNLGVIFDSSCSLNHHVNKLCKSLNYSIFNIGKIRKYLDKSTAGVLVNSLVTSKLDYCNSLLYGIKDCQIDRLQRCQNNAARVISLTRKYDHITPIMQDLHWLPVRYRIIYKILVLAHKSLYGKGPVYLRNLLAWYTPARSLRSSCEYLLVVPRWSLKSFGARRFEYAAPHLWNEYLPIELRRDTNLDHFKSSLKTCLFERHYLA